MNARVSPGGPTPESRPAAGGGADLELLGPLLCLAGLCISVTLAVMHFYGIDYFIVFSILSGYICSNRLVRPFNFMVQRLADIMENA